MLLQADPSPAVASALTHALLGRSGVAFAARTVVFSQGDHADALYYIASGQVTLTVVSTDGKAAVIVIMDQGTFVGEGCLAGQPLRLATASALAACTLVRIDLPAMQRLLLEDDAFAQAFTRYLLKRTVQVEETLVHQLFDSSEERLARLLLVLTRFAGESAEAGSMPRLSQETLAAMVGTTRSRISHFMNGFRRRDFIRYDRHSVEVRRALASVLPGYAQPRDRNGAAHAAP